MAITRFYLTQDPNPQLGKGDYEFFYSGNVQTGDDKKIPAKTKRQDVYVDQLAAMVQTANTGRDILVDFYANGVLLGTVTLTAGQPDKTLFTTNIGSTLITAGTVCTIIIRQNGLGIVGVTLSAWMRVSR
jgi:hypothetical protein